MDSQPYLDHDELEQRVRELEAEVRRLKETESRFHRIFDASPMGILIYKLEPGDRLVLNRINNAANSILQIDPDVETLIGKTIEEAFPPLVETEIPDRYRLAAADGTPWNTEQVNYQDETIAGAFEVHAFQIEKNTMAVMFQDISERKITEDALRKSEDQYRMITDNANEAILIAQGGIFKYSNPKGEELYGYSRDELAARPLTDFIHEDDRQLVAERHAKRVAGEVLPNIYPFRIIDKDGQIKWVELNVVLTLWDDRPATLCFMTDITERKRAEEALKDSEERYRSLVDLSPEAVIVHHKGRIDYINAECLKLFGASRPEELLGRDVFEIIHPDSRTAIKKRLEQLQRKREKIVPEELKYVKLDGTIIDVEASGAHINYKGSPATLSVIRDITEEKRKEKALEESEAYHRSLFEDSPTALFLQDFSGVARRIQALKASGVSDVESYLVGNPEEVVLLAGSVVFTRVNKAAIALYKAESSENLLKRLDQVLVENEHQHFIDQIVSFTNGSDWYENKARNHNLQGGIMDLIIRKSVVQRRENGLSKILVSLTDVTELNRTHREKERLEVQLLQSHKMESIGTLAGGIAHDFNNILSPIMVHSEMAMMDLPTESPVHYSLKQIYKAGDRARNMVKQILAFGRQKEQEKAPIRLSVVLKEAVRLLRSSIPTTIEIRQTIEAETDTVFADPTQIHQIILNLFTNASHAMKKTGGVIDAGLDILHLDSKAAGQYADLSAGSYIRMKVADTGHGIEPGSLGRIFEPYFTTKAVGEGTGMGLAVIHGIVKSHGGDIAVKSTPGEGTIFSILLPKYEDAVSEETEGDARLNLGTERILLVDDEKDAIDAFQPLLERFGYRLTARTSSIEALEAFRHNPDAFDLVITDQTMPNMTGRELAKGLMAIRPDIPIILCTGFSEQIDEEKAMKLGIKAFVMKPIVIREITETIRKVLDSH